MSATAGANTRWGAVAIEELVRHGVRHFAINDFASWCGFWF